MGLLKNSKAKQTAPVSSKEKKLTNMSIEEARQGNTGDSLCLDCVLPSGGGAVMYVLRRNCAFNLGLGSSPRLVRDAGRGKKSHL